MKSRLPFACAVAAGVLSSCKPSEGPPAPSNTADAYQKAPRASDSESTRQQHLHTTSDVDDVDAAIRSTTDIVMTGTPLDAGSALHHLARYHDPKVCTALISLLDHFAAKLPQTLPPLSELQSMERARRADPTLAMKSWFFDYDRAYGLMRTLALLGYPEGTSAAEKFYANLERNWGGSEGGRLYLQSIRWEIDHAKTAVQDGIAPWQLKPLPAQKRE